MAQVWWSPRDTSGSRTWARASVTITHAVMHHSTTPVAVVVAHH
ncbi:hypothetical protein ABZ208_33835 [Streptomyces sp. NPDC006208]